MQDLFSLLPVLSQLALDDCILEESDEEEENIDLDPVSTLRYVKRREIISQKGQGASEHEGCHNCYNMKPMMTQVKSLA